MIGGFGGPGVAFAVLAAFVWGGYLFVIKSYFAGYPASVILVGINVAAFCWYLPVAVLTTPSNAPLLPGSLETTAWLFMLGVIGVTALATGSMFRALAVGDVSYVAPVSKIVPVFVLPLEIVLLDEHLSTVQIAGVVIATFAVYLMNYRGGGLLVPLRKTVTYRPAQFALLSAMLFGIVDVSRRVILQEFTIPPRVWVLGLFGGMALLAAPVAIRSWPEGTRRDAPKFVATALFAVVGEHLTALAFDVAPASIASPIINTQAIVAVLLGGVVLHEERLRSRLGAAVIAVTGVALIAA
ncbi:DMT family transporter [Halococcus sp. PRR34]|uniref:DMT family transporter n=1 Tax=Halococcus sp. PRR34 TaxID=3020830 RepID=UPI0023612285|nr:DMT family transporter [Halococcus sp. PRR34]